MVRRRGQARLLRGHPYLRLGQRAYVLAMQHAGDLHRRSGPEAIRKVVAVLVVVNPLADDHARADTGAMLSVRANASA